MMEIPDEFLRRMKPLLGDEYEDFFREIKDGRPRRGLRVNTLPARFKEISPFDLTQSPLCRDGFIIGSDVPAGTHPMHRAGLYYLQEPSASAVIEALGPRPGMRILDMCASPGGKSTHIASKLKGNGLLVSNECVRSRVKPLMQNLERIGARNAAVTCAMPEYFHKYDGYFDAAVIDAPCSGEGMFRREPAASENWSVGHVEGCAVRQNAILNDAAETVRPGGVLIYSTCTMNPRENEDVVEKFLSSHPDFSMETISPVSLPPARPEWAGARDEIRLAARLMPHQVPGEGHFIAKMRRSGDERASEPPDITACPESEEYKVFSDFWNSFYDTPPWGKVCARGKDIWIVPPSLSGMAGMRVGVPAGTVTKGRFEPNHSLFMAADADHINQKLCFDIEDDELAAFLRGEVVPAPGLSGFTAVCLSASTGDFPIGFGKASGGVLKNKYPKGLRIR